MASKIFVNPVRIYSGEYEAFWAPNAAGYTADSAKAGIWEKKSAEDRLRGCGKEKKLVVLPASDVLEKQQLEERIEFTERERDRLKLSTELLSDAYLYLWKQSEEALLKERAACAKIADKYPAVAGNYPGRDIASAILNRVGQTAASSERMTFTPEWLERKAAEEEGHSVEARGQSPADVVDGLKRESFDEGMNALALYLIDKESVNCVDLAEGIRSLARAGLQWEEPEPKKIRMVDGMPRRNNLELLHPLEIAIREARGVVEEGPAHPLLTDASGYLEKALDKVADWVDADSEEEEPEEEPSSDAIAALERIADLMNEKGFNNDRDYEVLRIAEDVVDRAQKNKGRVPERLNGADC